MRRNTGVDAHFFAAWSPTMAYMLGVICADGCLVPHANGYHGLNITSKDLAWLEQLKLTLQALQQIRPKRNAYHFEVRNQVIYARLLQLGLTPRKSKSLGMPDVPSAVFGDFVRGYFDGDGCARTWQERRWGRSWQLRVTLTSGCLTFLDSLRERLRKEAGTGFGSLGRIHGAFRLQYTIRDSLRLHQFMYGGRASLLCLQRKRDIFERYLAVRLER
jgi:hypothetical protein